ncbi:hypothetical protein LCM23_17020 [Cytobacillus kochii]|nr:hypothetical protein [Cytobacillus kochii]MCA1027799.1 hypothetical protein [Cytobacillus kochii]
MGEVEERIVMRVSQIEEFKDEIVAEVDGFRATVGQAEDAAVEAEVQADYAKAQGDRAKTEADRLEGTDVSVLDNKVNDVDSRLTAQLADFEQQVSSIGELKVNGVYDTLTALQTALPTGKNGVFIVVDDGNWYFWNETVWTSGGVFQSTQWFKATTTQNEPWEVV